MDVPKGLRFPKFCSAVPDAMVDVSALLQISKRYADPNKPSRAEFVVVGESGSGRSSLIDAM